jgi:iron complex outermembrane receptor protein
MKFRKQALLITILFLLSPVPFAWAEDFKDFAELDLEELLNTEIVSASRKSQKLIESPNAIYVLTAEDIKRSGAVDVPDLFRLVPGVDVAGIYGNSYAVSARGFNDRFAQRMLVMIDGRSIYTSFFGGVFWENEEVFLEDIERIEIIRGPGGTMWGANSLNGVINIITRDPEEDQGLMVTGKAGSKRYREAVTSYSETIAEKFSYRITGGYREDQGTRGVNDFRRVPKATGRAKYKLSDNTTLHLFAGVNESTIGLDVTNYTTRTNANVRNNYEMLRIEHQISETSQLQIQGFHNYAAGDSKDKALQVKERKSGVEFQHFFALGERHRIVWGANYRNAQIKSTFLKPEKDHDDLVGGFLQDTFTLLDNLDFIAGIKYETNSFTGGDWSPRGCFLYSPASNHHLRFSVSRAYRTPSSFENSASTIRTLPAPLPPLPFAIAVGNEHMDAEKMTAYELGYRTTLFSRVGLNVELYYNDIKDVIENVRLRNIWPIVLSWDNAFNAISKGIEISANYPITPWWQLRANYTYQDIENKRDNKDIRGVPKHKFNIWSSFTFNNGFSLDLMAMYVDQTKWTGFLEDVKVDDYVRVDMRIAQKLFNDKLEIAFVGQNLTDKLHPEISDGLGNYEVERLFYGQIIFKY